MNEQPLTADEIATSLMVRGFLNLEDTKLPYHAKVDAIVIQLLAALEEGGEAARHLRRYLTGVIPLDRERLALEFVDLMIAATCAAWKAAGSELPNLVRRKLAADELRGFKHNKGAAADTETINRRAAVRAGIDYQGETTPDALADKIVELRYQLIKLFPKES